MNIDELVLKYATLMPARFKRKQKLLFINEISREYQSLGFEVKAVQSVRKGVKAINLLIGDLKNAKTLIVTNYDTPQRNYGRSLDYFPLNGSITFVNSLLAYYTPLLIGSVFSLFIIIVGMPKVDFTNNFWQSLIIVSSFILAFLFSTLLTFGVGNKFNYNRNSSGVIGSLLIADKLKNRKDVAYILTDMGCMNKAGDRMVVDALPKTLKDKHVILLDCLGYGARIGIGYRAKAKTKSEELLKYYSDDNIFFTELDETDLKYSSANYYEKCTVVSYGKKQNESFVVQNTSSIDDIEINNEAIEKISEGIVRFIKK